MNDYKNELRKKILDVNLKAVRLSCFDKLDESKDNNCIVNCNGIGRVRKYNRFSLFFENSKECNKKLLRGLNPDIDRYETQVFQLSGCNLRCWYCFVDDCILSANIKYSKLTSVKDMVDWCLTNCLTDQPAIIDLSGGQPDLVPEWCLWTMQEIESRGLKNEVYIWLDDNLTTTDLLEKHLSQEEIVYMAKFPKHSRACCFKGVNETSYKFNVRNNMSSLSEQIENFKKLYNYGFDLYAYITLTALPDTVNIKDLENFLLKIRDINVNLPLRLIPLTIKNFEVTSLRLNDEYKEALNYQFYLYENWIDIMHKYYTDEQLKKPFEEVLIK